MLHFAFDASKTRDLSGKFAGLQKVEDGLNKGMRVHVPPSQRHVLMRDAMGCLESGDDAYSFDENHLEQCTKQGVDQVRFERSPPVATLCATCPPLSDFIHTVADGVHPLGRR